MFLIRPRATNVGPKECPSFLRTWECRCSSSRTRSPSVTPSWYGDSVGHYDGDALVIDTVGIKIGPFSLADWFGTPYTEALHVVERYRLIEDEEAKEAEERNAKEHVRMPSRSSIHLFADPNYKGKALQLQFTVEDQGVFTGRWSAIITYWRSFD